MGEAGEPGQGLVPQRFGPVDIERAPPAEGTVEGKRERVREGEREGREGRRKIGKEGEGERARERPHVELPKLPELRQHRFGKRGAAPWADIVATAAGGAWSQGW